MMISIIPLYAGVLAILFIYLSVRVIRIRRRERIALGDKGNVHLRRAMAVQANFAEYAPLALLLGGFVEMQGFSSVLVHTIGLILVAGRFVHAYGVSQEDENYRFRVIGMSLTFLAIGLSSLILIGAYIST